MVCQISALFSKKLQSYKMSKCGSTSKRSSPRPPRSALKLTASRTDGFLYTGSLVQVVLAQETDATEHGFCIRIISEQLGKGPINYMSIV